MKRNYGPLVFLGVLSAIPSLGFAGQFFVMPKQLVEDAKSHQCEPINDFYDQPTITAPPYLFDEKDTGPEPGYIYWCRRPSKGDATQMENLLVVKSTLKFNAFAGCPNEIVSRNVPNGIRLKIESNLSLGFFRYLENTKRKGPAAFATNPMIVSGDEITENFYCHKGKWLVYVRD